MTKLRYSYSIDHPIRCDPDLFVKQQKILLEKYDAHIELTVIDSDTRMKTALLRILKVENCVSMFREDFRERRELICVTIILLLTRFPRATVAPLR